MTDSCKIYPAQPADAPFIAQCVLAGIDMYELGDAIPERQMPVFKRLTEICLMNDTLYSYRNAVISKVAGKAVGALVSYDGGRYAALREKTFGLVRQNSNMDLSKNAMETGEGEYYLDSMSIMPSYRGLGIGKELIKNRVDWALNNGFSSVTLLVDKDKPRLQRYYESIGFAFSEEIFVFGGWYNKMKLY